MIILNVVLSWQILKTVTLKKKKSLYLLFELLNIHLFDNFELKNYNDNSKLKCILCIYCSKQKHLKEMLNNALLKNRIINSNLM